MFEGALFTGSFAGELDGFKYSGKVSERVLQSIGGCVVMACWLSFGHAHYQCHAIQCCSCAMHTISVMPFNAAAVPCIGHCVTHSPTTPAVDVRMKMA